jgi:HlyD family secretion protein
MARKLELSRYALTAAALAAMGLTTSCGWFGKGGNALSFHGNVEMTEVEIAFRTPGKIVELNAEEGDTVKKGQVLAKLDVDQLSRQREREAAGLTAAQTALEQARTAVRFGRANVDGEIALRAAELKAAESMLDQALAGSRTQEIQQAKASVDAAATRNEKAARDWERAQTLYKNDDISTSQYDSFRSVHEAASADLDRARENFAMVKEGPRKEQIANARAQVERARAALRLAEASRIDLERREQEVSTRQADIDRARAQVAVIDQQISDATVVAPVDGVVLVKAAEPGEVVAAGTSVLTVANVSRPWVRGFVAESDLGRVKLGDKVRVTTDSFPGKAYPGTITFIAQDAEFTPKTIQTTEERVKLVYRVKVTLENPKGELKLNMPVDADVELAQR